MSSTAEYARNALAELEGCLPDAKPRDPFGRRVWRAAELLRTATRAASEPDAEMAVANAILQLMRAGAARDDGEAVPAVAAQAAERSLDILKGVRAGAPHAGPPAVAAPAMARPQSLAEAVPFVAPPAPPPVAPVVYAPPPPVAVPAPPTPAPTPRRPALLDRKRTQSQAAIRSRVDVLRARRAHLLTDLTLRWRDLARLDEGLGRQQRAAGWVGAPAGEQGAGAPLASDEASLVALLDGGSESLAAAAARTLARRPSREGLQAVLEALRRNPARARADAFVHAAAVMGSPQALDEARQRVEAGAESEDLLHALAIAGTAGDAELVAASAARGGPHANLAALVVGHLGAAAAVVALPGTIDATVRTHALELVFGDAPPDPSARVRLIHGKPWTPRRALRALTDPDEWVVVRALRAWELPARLGIEDAPWYDPRSPAAEQAACARALGRRVPATDDGAGQWSFSPPRLD